MDAAGHGAVAACTDGVGHHHVRAHGNPDEQVDEHVNDERVRAHGRQSLVAANCPTTATSARLNICWKMLLKAIGMANLRIFLPRGPFSISMFVFDAAMQYLENGRKFSF